MTIDASGCRARSDRAWRRAWSMVDAVPWPFAVAASERTRITVSAAVAGRPASASRTRVRPIASDG